MDLSIHSRIAPAHSGGHLLPFIDCSLSLILQWSSSRCVSQNWRFVFLKTESRWWAKDQGFLIQKEQWLCFGKAGILLIMPLVIYTTITTRKQAVSRWWPQSPCFSCPCSSHYLPGDRSKPNISQINSEHSSSRIPGCPHGFIIGIWTQKASQSNTTAK